MKDMWSVAKWEGDCFWCSRLKVRFLPPQEREMIADRRSMVGKVMTGYAGKKASVTVISSVKRRKVVSRLVAEGYRKGYNYNNNANCSARTKNGAAGVLRVDLGYTVSGNVVRPALSSMVRLSKETRPRYVSAEERWVRNGEAGRLRRETTEGRRTGPEARKKGLGGRRRRSVR